MSAPLLYVTGTNTGIGKTTLACSLLRRAKRRNLKIAALKPFCSGGRDDGERLHALQTAGLSLDEVNPFYFKEPLAPLVAARNESVSISLEETIAAMRKVTDRGQLTLIEGAGGLMSPLGERFTLLDIIGKEPGRVCVVGSNSLGTINSALLTYRALANFDVHFVLMNPAEVDRSAETNADLIREWTQSPTVVFPFLRNPEDENTPVVDSILDWWLKPK